MKTSLLQLTVLCAATIASADTMLFHSESSGTFTILSDPALPTFEVGIEHPTVNATPFGIQSLSAHQTVSLIGTPSIAGAFILTDLGGDLIYGSYLTDLVFLGPTEAMADGTISFNGGTGRYSEASGGGLISAAIHLANGTSEIVLDGRLAIPESGGALAVASLGLVGAMFLTRRSSERARQVRLPLD